jgi:16S rRNA (guanine527-N7)-methyltransferase
MAGELPDNAKLVFGDRIDLAQEFAEMLREHGVERGLIGPREVDRIWERHVLNSAVIAELLPQECRCVDVGSGAGLPGIPLAIARPDVQLTLLEPMARRVAWLNEVVERLGLDAVTVVRGRAEEGPVREQLKDSDVVTARAVAPLEKLARWCLPLLRPGGQLVALKGESANEELERDREAVRKAGGTGGRVTVAGADVLEVPTTLIVIDRQSRKTRRDR